MSTPEQPTCGKGLAENSVFPARLADVTAAMAENLEVHMKALDQTDQNSRREHDVYKSLVKELQQAADRLRATANQMAGARDLPMGRHDEKAMTHPRIYETFERFVKGKRELSALLEQTSARDNQLLETMRVHSR
jgi:formiminotetrahydrofolate cyclodeaminase